MLAKIYVTLKQGVLDPQGGAVMKSLHTMGYEQVENVRVGKYMEVKLTTTDRAEARAQIDQMCQTLLANPVIEDYQFEIEED